VPDRLPEVELASAGARKVWQLLIVIVNDELIVLSDPRQIMSRSRTLAKVLGETAEYEAGAFKEDNNIEGYAASDLNVATHRTTSPQDEEQRLAFRDVLP
jgi:hypothetical protein